MHSGSNITILSILSAFLLLLVTWKPEMISDDNGFLKKFVDQDLLTFMGIILTLSIGLLAQLYLSVERLAERLGYDAVNEIRDELRSTAKYLVYLFFVALFLVLIKPLFPATVVAAASINAIVIFVVAFYLLILADVVLSIFDFDA